MITTSGRTWAVTGAIAGLAGIVGIQTSATIGVAYDEAHVEGRLRVLAAAAMVTVLFLALFAAAYRIDTARGPRRTSVSS